MRPPRGPELLVLSLWALPAVDAAIAALSAVLSSVALTLVRYKEPLWPLSQSYLVAVLLASILTPLILQRMALYRSHRGENIALELIQVTIGWFLALGILAVISILTKTNTLFSRVWMVSWLLSGMLLFWAFRIGLRSLLANLRLRGWDTRDIVMIGGGREAARVARRLVSMRGAGYRVVGYFSHGDTPDAYFAGRRCLGTLDSISRVIHQLPKKPAQAWIALPGDRADLLQLAVDQLSDTTLDCNMVPDTREFNILNYSIGQTAGMPVVLLSHSPMAGWNRAIKALEDKILATTILLTISPLLVLLALAVKLESRGPVLFRQIRHGWNGEEITVLKFRTMRLHEEAPGQVTQATKGDPRITRLGALLRRTSLDELPQFLNVLAGTMSVVGPRPHAVEHNEMYKKLVKGYALRHKVKPGITGWAQVNGFRGETENLDMMRKRIEYDLYYIEHWSIWFDLAIVGLTVVRGLVSKKAY